MTFGLGRPSFRLARPFTILTIFNRSKSFSMTDIHIKKDHALGLAEARRAALEWVQQAEKKFDMRCTYEEGDSLDEIRFTRSGISGTLRVSGDTFEVDAQLGFFLGVFKDRIEAEIIKNLDALLAVDSAGGKNSAGQRVA